jgi:UDP-2,4-diacetamido-2,4,6-trideoxy-beta-L-altropyranose hydrolase
MTRLRVVLRADAGANIGIGHAVRCLTLGEALVERDVGVALVTESMPDALVERARRFSIDVERADGHQIVTAIERRRPALVVVDGYHLRSLLSELSARDLRYAVIDDNRELPLEGAALVLNQNLHATPELYADLTTPTLLLGPRYVLLRRDVARLRATGRRRTADHVLITLGGADPQRLTLAIAVELFERSTVTVWLGVGAANPARAELAEFAARHPARVRVAGADLIDAYRQAAVAVIGAGTTTWETGYLGLPAIALTVADNQVAAGHAAERHGLVDVVDARRGADAGSIADRCLQLLADHERRRAMAARGRALFDDLGPTRVAEEIERVARA